MKMKTIPLFFLLMFCLFATGISQDLSNSKIYVENENNKKYNINTEIPGIQKERIKDIVIKIQELEKLFESFAYKENAEGKTEFINELNEKILFFAPNYPIKEAGVNLYDDMVFIWVNQFSEQFDALRKYLLKVSIIKN